MAKLPWYIKTEQKGAVFVFHPIWVLWQVVKIWFRMLSRLSKRKNVSLDIAELRESDNGIIEEIGKEYSGIIKQYYDLQK